MLYKLFELNRENWYSFVSWFFNREIMFRDKSLLIPLKINVLYRKNLNIDWLQTNNELMVYQLNDTKHQIIGLLDIVLTMFLLNQQIL